MTVDLASPKLRSYTQLTTYQECGEKYRLKYIEKHREDPAVWNIGGTAFHSCAEWLLTGLGPLLTETDQMWEQAWQLATEEVFERNPHAPADIGTWRAANQGREGVDWWMAEGPKMVDQLRGWLTTTGKDMKVITDADGPLIERRIEINLYGVPIVVIPDAVMEDEYGQVNILDWKSGRKPPSGSLQLGTYRTGLLVGYGLNAVWGHFYHTRKAVLLPHDLTVWTPEEVGRLFYEFDSAERAEQYPPRPGGQCNYCGFRDHCEYKEIQ